MSIKSAMHKECGSPVLHTAPTNVEMSVEASRATTSTLGLMMSVTIVSWRSSTLSIISCSSDLRAPLTFAPMTIIRSSSSETLLSSDS